MKSLINKNKQISKQRKELEKVIENGESVWVVFNEYSYGKV